VGVQQSSPRPNISPALCHHDWTFRYDFVRPALCCLVEDRSFGSNCHHHTVDPHFRAYGLRRWNDHQVHNSRHEIPPLVEQRFLDSDRGLFSQVGQATWFLPFTRQDRKLTWIKVLHAGRLRRRLVCLSSWVRKVRGYFAYGLVAHHHLREYPACYYCRVAS